MIRAGYDLNNIPRVADSPLTPDFARLAEGFRCHYAAPETAEAFMASVRAALTANAPTLIIVNQDSRWVCNEK